jgi:hypothetical protein
MPIISEVKQIARAAEDKPHHTLLCTMLKLLNGDKNLPEVMGLCMPGEVFVFINSVALIDDFFVNQN